jgi:hypothetical protein
VKLVLAAVLVSVAVAVVAVMLGVWWAPFVVGIAIGIAFPRARVAIPAGAVAGFLAWGLPLGADQLLYGLRPAAESLAAILHAGHQAAIPVILTCTIGLLLGLSGAWLGYAGRSLVGPRGGSYLLEWPREGR